MSDSLVENHISNDYKHIHGGYYLNIITGYLYSRRGADMEGLRPVKWNNKLREMTQISLLSTVKRLQEENEKLNQWKREEIAVWGPLHDYFLTEDKLIKIGESIAAEALRRSKDYVRLQEEREELVEALNSITYKDSWGGVIRIGQHGDSEVPEIVYKALKSSELNK